MNADHCVIVGGSHAGAQVCLSLRQEGYQGSITLISDEDQLPYNRPPLSKSFLHGNVTEEKLLLRPDSFYEKQSIDVLLSTRVSSISRQEKTIELMEGSFLAYKNLVLATGAKPRQLDVPGAELSGVFYLRTLGDVRTIKNEVRPGDRAVIVGGGYIGLETAASLRSLGMNVTIVESMPRILQRVTADKVSAFYTRVHREEGASVITDTNVVAFHGDKHLEAVEVSTGEHIRADLAIIGIGVVPEIGLAQQSGLDIASGILVDEYARTSDKSILSVGDCSEHYNPIYKRRIRLESVQNAVDQSKIAAKTICGELEPYSSLPWFWSDQYDMKLQIAGLSSGYDKLVLRGDPENGRSFAAFYLEGNRLLAVDAVNRAQEFMVCRRALTRHIEVDPDKLADESIPPQEML